MSEATMEQLTEIRDMLARVLERLEAPAQALRENYSVEEVAAILEKQPYTVREWCRMGRINATKRNQKRGGVELWNVSSPEIHRFREQGLLPVDPLRNA